MGIADSIFAPIPHPAIGRRSVSGEAETGTEADHDPLLIHGIRIIVRGRQFVPAQGKHFDVDATLAVRKLPPSLLTEFVFRLVARSESKQLDFAPGRSSGAPRPVFD